MYKVVELTLGSPENQTSQKVVKINALVVNGLNPIHMTGVCKFATKLKNKGIKLADSRLINSKKDTVATDLLLGADYYDLIVSPLHKSIQVCGMWLSKTTFGHHLLKGRIPGSSEAVRQDVNANFITIQHIANYPILPILNNYQQVSTNNVLDIVREENSYDALGVSMVESDGNEKLLPLNSNSIVHNKANSIFTVREHKPNKFNLRKESFKIPQLIAAITLMLCLVTILSKIVTTNFV